MVEEYIEDEDGNRPLTAAEEIELEEYIKNYGNPASDQKHTVHSFLHDVAISNDTLKTGNLTPEEVGAIRLPVRTIKEFSLYAKELCEDEVMEKIFNGESEGITASSLSKDAKLITLAVIQKREWMTSSKQKKENSGWFRKKEVKQLSDYQE